MGLENYTTSQLIEMFWSSKEKFCNSTIEIAERALSGDSDAVKFMEDLDIWDYLKLERKINHGKQ